MKPQVKTILIEEVTFKTTEIKKKNKKILCKARKNDFIFSI